MRLLCRLGWHSLDTQDIRYESESFYSACKKCNQVIFITEPTETFLKQMRSSEYKVSDIGQLSDSDE